MRESMKKWILSLVTIPMLALLFVWNTPVSAQAAEDGDNYVTVDLSEYILQAGGLGGSSTQPVEDGEYILEENWLSSETEALEATLCNGWNNWSDTIDVSAYHLTTSEFVTLYWNFLNLHPEMFHVESQLSYSQQSGYVTRVYPRYSEVYTQAHINAFNQKVNEIMAGVNGSWPDIEKILYLHDYMVTHIEYDETYSKYDAYNALIEGSCVCQGYTLAYIHLLNQIDVNVDYIVSWDLNHAWNLIELGGEYFYTDVTWDDPLGTSEDYCGHTNFMVDQQGLVDAGHDTTDWDAAKLNRNVYNTLATSNKYMDGFWRGMQTAIPLVGTKAGYLSGKYVVDGKIYIYDFETNTTTGYDKYTERWYVWDMDNSWYTYDYCSMVTAAGAFYYTTPQAIYRMDLNGNSTKVYNLSASEAALGYIYGLEANGNTLTYILQTEPSGDATYTGTYRIITDIDKFVTRMYQQCLDREPDQSGLDGWVSQLEGGHMNGAQIAEQFVFSAEMLAKNLSNEEFVNVLYRAMMGREADAAGRTGWVNELSNGYLTRSEVTKAFVESTEFSQICNSYGITRGNYDASMAPIEHFVTRFYTLCLEREPDQAGLYGWVNNLKNQHMNGAQIAEQFFFSDEFVGKNVSDEKYVELLYNTLLGRQSDVSGKAGWVGELQNGYMTRRGMMKAFIESTEFGEICENYGITRGSVE